MYHSHNKSEYSQGHTAVQLDALEKHNLLAIIQIAEEIFVLQAFSSMCGYLELMIKLCFFSRNNKIYHNSK